MSAACDIYSKSLRGLGHGFPVWCPEPSQETGEIRIGDVGFMRDGIFICLFNALASADDPVNTRRGVPEGFEPMAEPQDRHPITNTQRFIDQLVFHSSGLRRVDDPVESSRSNATSATDFSGIRFRCTGRRGAVLLLGSPGIYQRTHSKRRIETYMRQHHSSWMAFANDQLGLKLRDEDLLFISGTTKTSSWVNVAFSKGDSKGYLNVEGGGIASLGGGQLRAFMSQANDASVFARAGPTDATGADGEQPANQCVFVNYYHMVRRRVWRSMAMRAAAGAHQLDIHPDDHPASLRTVNVDAASISDLESDWADVPMKPFVTGILASGPNLAHSSWGLVPFLGSLPRAKSPSEDDVQPAPTALFAGRPATPFTALLPDAPYQDLEHRTATNEEPDASGQDYAPCQTRDFELSLGAELVRIALRTEVPSSARVYCQWIYAATSPSSVMGKSLPSVKLGYVLYGRGNHSRIDRVSGFCANAHSTSAAMLASVA